MADVYPQQHDQVTFHAGTDRRLIFRVEQLPDLNGLLQAEWVLIRGKTDVKGHRVYDNGGEVVLGKSLGGGIQVLDAGNRVIAVTVLPLDTQPSFVSQVTGRFFDQLKLRLGSGRQDVVSYGNYRILPSEHQVL